MCRENRATHSKMHGENKSATAARSQESLLRSCRETRSAATFTTLEGGLFPQAVSVISLFSSWYLVGVSPDSLLLFR